MIKDGRAVLVERCLHNTAIKPTNGKQDYRETTGEIVTIIAKHVPSKKDLQRDQQLKRRGIQLASHVYWNRRNGA